MNIKSVSFGLIASTMMAGLVSSCTETKYEDKAKAQAVKYLNADDFLKAERYASQQKNNDVESVEEISYWDSILIEAKSNEAYIKGQQLIIDSLNNNHHRKVKYKAVLDTILPSNNLAEMIKAEYANYVSAEDFIKMRDNAPSKPSTYFYNNKPISVHYWNLITIAGKQQEAYNKGMSDERAKHTQDK